MRGIVDSLGWLLVVPTLALFVSGCSDPGVPFERVAAGGRAEPGAQIVSSNPELEALWPTLLGTGQIPQIDFDRYLLIGVFLGERSTGGYALRVESVTRRRGDLVRIDVQVREPRPDEFVTMAFTYPGEFIAVERRHLPRAQRWQLQVWDRSKGLLFETKVEGTV